MNKIGVLTFHRASNYGAVLQTWALQEALRSMEVPAEVVDYRSPFLERHYTPDGWRTLLNPRKLGIALLRNGYMRDRREIFEEFVRAEIPLSVRAYEPDSLSQADHSYRGFLTGSDQVWNYETAGFDPAFFLDFVSGSGRRGAYAASFGFEILPEEHRSEYRRLLGAMDAVTVREDAGADVYQDLMGVRPPVVLDPTLLLDRDRWASFAQLGRGFARRYVLVYLLAETRQILDYARALGRAHGYEVVYISQRLFRPSRGMHVLDSATPHDFVRLVQDAAAVVTNSFHGVAFALNLDSELHFDYLPEPSKVNSRLRHLADRFELHSRRIGSNEILVSDREVDAAARRSTLAAERARSLAQLRDTVGSLG